MLIRVLVPIAPVGAEMPESKGQLLSGPPDNQETWIGCEELKRRTNSVRSKRQRCIGKAGGDGRNHQISNINYQVSALIGRGIDTKGLVIIKPQTI